MIAAFSEDWHGSSGSRVDRVMNGQHNAIEQIVRNRRAKWAICQEGLIDRGQFFTEKNAIMLNAAQAPVNADA